MISIARADTYTITLENISNIPSDYTELEYIESTGTQYIDTGIKGNQNSKAELKYQYYQISDIFGSGRIFGSRSDIAINSFVIGTNSGYSDTSSTFFMGYGNQKSRHLNTYPELDTWFTFIFDRLNQKINGEEDVAGYDYEIFETPQNLKLFYFDSATPGKSYGIGRLAYAKLWDGNTLIRNFVPAKNSSDIVGLYDMVSDTFFTNSGTGTFFAGPVVNVRTYTYGVGAIIDEIPTRDGYVFAGWCTDIELTNCAMTQTIDNNATGNKIFYAKWNQIISCPTRYYLPANTDGCVICPVDSYCGGGTYTFNETVPQGIVSCGAGLFAPSGMSSLTQCGRILHIGDEIVYLHSVKKTTPALHVDIDQDGTADFFGNMTTLDVPMTRGTDKKLKLQYDGVTYSVYDDSVDLSEYQN
jgi:uncharacterized repeat protein (TIGR02543 family)